MDEEDVVRGVLDREGDLLRREADVDGVEHRPHHRHGEEGLQVPVAVVVHHRHGVARLHPERREGAREPVDPLAELPVRDPHLAPVDDLLVRGVEDRGLEEPADGQVVRVWVGGMGGDVGHGRLLDGGERPNQAQRSAGRRVISRPAPPPAMMRACPR